MPGNLACPPERSGRLPYSGALTTDGLAIHAYSYVAFVLDADYLITSVGASPDGGSTAGQLRAFVGTVNGGPTFGGGAPVKAQGELLGYSLGGNFGGAQNALLQDTTDPNLFVTLYTRANPSWPHPDVMPRVRAGDYLLLLLQDTVAGDGTARAAQVEVIARQVA